MAQGLTNKGLTFYPAQDFEGFRAYLSADQNDIVNITWTTLVFDTEEYDIGTNYATGTGIFVAPYDGYYHLAGSLRFEGADTDAGDSGRMRIYNSTSTTLLAYTQKFFHTNNNVMCLDTHAKVYLTAGDNIIWQVYHDMGDNNPDIDGAQGLTWGEAYLISKPYTSINDFYGFRATSDDAQSMADSSNQTVIYEDEVYDIGSDYNSATGEYTAPYTGYYHFDAATLLTNTAWVNGERTLLALYVDGTSTITLERHEVEDSETMYLGASGGCDIKLTAGEVVTMRLNQNSGGAVNLHNSSTNNYFNGHLIARV